MKKKSNCMYHLHIGPLTIFSTVAGIHSISHVTRQTLLTEPTRRIVETVIALPCKSQNAIFALYNIPYVMCVIMGTFPYQKLSTRFARGSGRCISLWQLKLCLFFSRLIIYLVYLFIYFFEDCNYVYILATYTLNRGSGTVGSINLV